MLPYPGLEALLAALGEAGLRVGVTERLRLQQVFGLAPVLSPNPEQTPGRLKSVLRALLVKSAQDRADFDRIFDAWLRHTDSLLQPKDSLSDSARSTSTETPIAQPWHRRLRTLLRTPAYLIGAGILLLALLIGFMVNFSQPEPPPPVEPLETIVEDPDPDPEIATPKDPRQRKFTSWVPQLTVIPAKPQWTGWPLLGCGLLALLSALGLWLSLGRKSWLPQAAPLPARKGPPRIFLSSAAGTVSALLDSRQQETLVWGIGRFVAEESTRQLDLPATVRATARSAGFAQLIFRQARYHREVWLWLDDAVVDPTLPLIAYEVEAALTAHGLRMERALFRGIPDQLQTESGGHFAPREVDERRDLALVAILTDGRLLTRQYEADNRRVRIDALLRGLSHWPHIAFVNFSANHDPLARILRPHDLVCIRPEALAAFLGGEQTALSAQPAPASRDPTWAAACALSPASVAEQTALNLREKLGLRSSPWSLSRLRSEAPGPPGRLLWPPARRIALLRWLSLAEGDLRQGLARESLLAKALRFWVHSYQQELIQRDKNDAENPWRDTPAQLHLSMELQLLRLWTDPESAIPPLYRLHQGSLQQPVRAQLQQLAAFDLAGEDHIPLPWSWRERSPEEQAMLAAMGFGATSKEIRLRRPGRLWIGLSGSAGLALGALALAALSPWKSPQGPPVFEQLDQPPALSDSWFNEQGANGWTGYVTTPQWLKSVATADAATIQVRWQREAHDCVQRIDDQAEIWRCGTSLPAQRVSPEIHRSLAVLVADATASAVTDLASDLLSGGSADLVLIAPHWPERWESVLSDPQRLQPNQQLLVIEAGKRATSELQQFALPTGGSFAWLRAPDWQTLRNDLTTFVDIRPLTSVWTNSELVAGRLQNQRLGGIGGCRPSEEEDTQGMRFVRLCPGTFSMGSDAKDRLARSSENPAHQVTLNGFAIGKYEVTNAQYRRLQPDHHPKAVDELPVVNVSWDDAKAFCAANGHRLPTEAEWEYAARAGTQTTWSHGDDESELEKYEWYVKNSGGKVHPVGTLEANPWGLHDMHGNVWEWVADWYGGYSAEPQQNPQGPGEGKSRVLRGGAFSDEPRDLRSADRDWLGPGFSSWFIGFRCVRGPRRQP